MSARLDYRRVAAASAFAVALLASCDRPADVPLRERIAPPEPSRAEILVLGDVEGDEPVRRVRWIEPLADYLAGRLGEHGIRDGRVVIARDLDEMSRMLTRGEVDLYLDSPLPSVAMRRLAGSRILLRRWVRGEAQYWSVFFTYDKSGVETLSDLRGRVLALQEPSSTSGYLLPLQTLERRGLTFRQVSSSTAPVDGGTIGAFIAGDEENVIEMVRTQRAVAGVVSSQDFADLPAEARERLVSIGRSDAVPRSLISARADLAPEIVDEVRALLLAISDDDREAMAAGVAGGGWTWKFDELPEEERRTLAVMEASVLARLGLQRSERPPPTVQ